MSRREKNDAFSQQTFEQLVAELDALERRAMQLPPDSSKRLEATSAIRQARMTFRDTKTKVSAARRILARPEPTFRGLDETVPLGPSSTVTRTGV
jgi:hypothetical protein